MTTDLGLPGTIADTYLILPPGLGEKKIAEALYLLGRIGRATPWWTADVLLYGEAHLPEGRFSQVAEEAGLAPATLANLLWVGRRWPRSRRRDEASFANHAELAALEPEAQDHWLARAIEGDRQPNGEHRRWSVTTLRERVRGARMIAVQSNGEVTVSPTAPASGAVEPESTAGSVSAASHSASVFAGFQVGSLLGVLGIGACRVKAITARGSDVVITCVLEG